MTNLNYSISGLKDLLSDLENIATCIVGLSNDHISPSLRSQLLEEQLDLIQSINGYAMMLQAIEAKPDLLKNDSLSN